MDSDFENRIKELYARSYTRSVFTYTDFLSVGERTDVEKAVGKNNVVFFGGSDDCERTIARFGDEASVGYEGNFPVVLLKITLVSGKFTREITHRDVLGSVLALGLKRCKIGDIFVSRETAYLFVGESIADYISNELKKISSYPVKIEFADYLPEWAKPKTEDARISVASNRIDAIIARAYGMSRDESLALIKKGFIAVNGTQTDKNERKLLSGDVVSARGFGKFKFCGESGASKKGKLYVQLEIYK